jgi:hypothetical protein
MPVEGREIVEAAVLTALADRLEAALDLAAGADAAAKLDAIAELCVAAAKIARGGAALLS